MTLTLFGTLNAHISFNVQPLHCKCNVMYIHYTVMYFNVSIRYSATLYCSIVNLSLYLCR